MGTGELTAGDNPAIDWHPIQGGGGGSRKTPIPFMQKKPK